MRVRILASALLGAAVACGIELETAPGAADDDGGSSPPGTSSGEPGSSNGGTTSSSGAQTTSSSGAQTTSSSGQNDPPDVDVPADPCDPAVNGFHLDDTSIVDAVCTAADTRCTGDAHVDDSKVFLTTSAPSEDSFAGVFWRKLGLLRNASFRLDVRVSARPPKVDGGAEDGIPGLGFALAFVQADDPGAFPDVADPSRPKLLGIGRLGGGHGAAAYVKTYNGPNATAGVFALRTTQIPSTNDDEVDDFIGDVGNDETFPRTQRVVIDFEITGRPGLDPHVKMLRYDEVLMTSHVIQELDIPLPDMQRLDYFGVSAARGNDQYCQSAHRLESISLTCNP